MRRNALIKVLVLTAALAATQAARAADTPAGVATVAAATADFSSPEKTWATICAALKAEDLAGFRAGFHNSSEMSRLFMAAYSELTVTTFHLANAIELVPGGRAASQRLQGVYSDLVKSGENRTTEISGAAQDEATWSRRAKDEKGEEHTEVTYFKKVNGKWLIDTERSYALDHAEGRKSAEVFVENAKKEVPRLKKIIEDIEANRVKSLDDLRKRLTE